MNQVQGKGFLAPYRILDLTDERGLMTGHWFAQLGADVIQIEPSTGSTARATGPFDKSGESLFWSTFAAGKRGATLNLEQPEGQEMLRRLVAEADLLIESFPVSDRGPLGVDHEMLKAANPRLIHLSITAFGSDGPKANYADSDLAVWASAGSLWPHRAESGLPLRVSVPQSFHHAAMDAACGGLVALMARHTSGAGQHVDVSAQQSSLLCAMSAYMAPAMEDTGYTSKGSTFSEMLRKLNGGEAFSSKWRVRDGLVEMNLSVGPISGRSANALFGWLRDEGGRDEGFAEWDWVTLPKELEAGEVSGDDIRRARTVIADIFLGYSKMELLDVAQARGILLAPVMEGSDLLNFEHLRERNFFGEVGEGESRRPLPMPFRTACEGAAVDQMRAAPARGEHNVEVYGELLGISADGVHALAEQGVI